MVHPVLVGPINGPLGTSKTDTDNVASVAEKIAGPFATPSFQNGSYIVSKGLLLRLFL